MTTFVAVLVAPGASPAGAVDALRAAGAPEPAVVELPAPGAWAAARNAALELARDAEVLALVEDDVRVDPGWGAALAGAFADPRVAVAGGPLRGVHAPAWLRGEHDEVLGLAAPDPAAPVFAGGNVALRVTALRGVGGFFPVRGHRDARDTFGDDRRAQQELRAAGWDALYLPGLAAARDLSGLTPRELLRRRAHTGARRTALHAGPSRAAALTLAVRSGAAAAVRAARGDRDGALDRAAWAADGAGALLGAGLAHGELQPDRASTPLRAAVPPPAPAPGVAALRGTVRRRRRGAPVHGAILLYHRVAAIDDDPLALSVSPAHFAGQLEALIAQWTPAPLEAVVAGDAGPSAVAITFDDGYMDNLLGALPALALTGVPATVFVSTGHVRDGTGFWWDEVGPLVAAGAAAGSGVLEVDLPGGRRAWAPDDAASAAAVRAQVHAALQPCDRPTIDGALMELRSWAGRPPVATAPPERDRPLTVDELRALAAAGPFAVAAHGRTHVSLAHAAPATRAAELRGSADDLEAWLGPRPRAFSYPFGVPGADVDAATRAAARDAGYDLAVINAPGLVRAGGDPFALPRLAVPDVDGAAFARWLSAALPGR